MRERQGIHILILSSKRFYDGKNLNYSNQVVFELSSNYFIVEENGVVFE